MSKIKTGAILMFRYFKKALASKREKTPYFNQEVPVFDIPDLPDSDLEDSYSFDMDDGFDCGGNFGSGD